MAEIEFEFPVKGIRGKIFEGMIIKRSPQGKLVVSKRPDMTRVRWSKAQKANRQRFKLAVAYAKAALADPKIRAKYEKMAKKQKKRPWDIALSEGLEKNQMAKK